MELKTDVEDYLNQRIEHFRKAQIETLKYVGDMAVTEARERHRYADQTGNLSSSVGYCIAEDGEIIFGGGFDVVKNGDKGAHEGRSFLQRLASEHSTGLVLIIVAGMNYAAYVEAKNLNVLDSAEQLVERMLPKLLKSLK